MVFVFLNAFKVMQLHITSRVLKSYAQQNILSFIQSLRKDVAGAQSEMQKLSEDLEALKKLCSSLQQGYQEYCPDIRRHEAEVKNLQSRYANVSNQLNER